MRWVWNFNKMVGIKGHGCGMMIQTSIRAPAGVSWY